MEGDARQIASAADDSANSRSLCMLWRFSSEVVGATGFEPATPCAQGRCATRLRYAPTLNCFILDHLPGLVPAHLPFLSQNPRIDRPVSKPSCTLASFEINASNRTHSCRTPSTNGTTDLRHPWHALHTTDA